MALVHIRLINPSCLHISLREVCLDDRIKEEEYDYLHFTRHSHGTVESKYSTI